MLHHSCISFYVKTTFHVSICLSIINNRYMYKYMQMLYFVLLSKNVYIKDVSLVHYMCYTQLFPPATCTNMSLNKSLCWTSHQQRGLWRLRFKSWLGHTSTSSCVVACLELVMQVLLKSWLICCQYTVTWGRWHDSRYTILVWQHLQDRLESTLSHADTQHLHAQLLHACLIQLKKM